MRSLRSKLGTIILFLGDLVILFLITALALLIRDTLPSVIPGYPLFTREIGYSWWFFPVWITVLSYEGAYSKRFTFWDEVKMLWRVAIVSSFAILGIVFVGKVGESVSRTVVILIGALSLVLFPVLRIMLKRLLFISGLMKRKVVILGASDMGLLALKALRGDANLGYEVVGFLDDEISSKVTCIEGIKVHRWPDRIERYLRRADIHDVVITLPEYEKEKLCDLITRLQHKTSSILYFPDLTGMAVIGTELRHFFQNQTFALEIKNNLAQPMNIFIKRFIDYVAGGMLLLILIFPIAIITILIRLSSPGAAIYRHARIGKNNTPFECYKFRTMYCDADKRLGNILDNCKEAKQEWETYRKLSNDPRITPIGNLLRKTSLDELPQILNVLKGEMSLVGPRPVTREEIDKYYRESADLCFSVPPGITGLWQVSGRSNASYAYRISLDSWYVRNWNLWLDVIILLRTMLVIVRREGAR